MEISEKWWEDYVRRLSAISAEAGELMQEYLDENLLDDDYAMIEYAYALATRYGEAAAALACEMYDSVADASGLFLPPAEPAPTATFEETAAAVRGTQKNRRNSVPDTVSRLTKQAAADTTLQNAQRDGAQFAWVPHGDTCAFCMMLASNGWQNMSRKALKNGHAEHIHAHCDCEYAVRFDDSTTIAGYDPDRYYDMYSSAEGSTWEEKVNSMRREQYARNKEYINAQKRAAYAERKERLSGNKINDRINRKFTDHFIDLFAENPDTAYSFEEIDAAMKASEIGIDAAEYIANNGYTVTMDYDPNAVDYAGAIFGKDIYIYPLNNKDAEEIACTIIHELCHERYGWDKTMEDEVNCRLMEVMHSKGSISQKDIKEIVKLVRELYSGYPEGNLYGF